MTKDQIEALNDKLRELAESLERNKAERKQAEAKIPKGVLAALRDEPRDE
jgi:hypothetical protein